MKIPAGYQTVMPYLILQDARSFKEFVTNVFNAEIKMENFNEDGTPNHSEICIGESTIMFSNTTDQYSIATANMFVFVPDADVAFAKALENGASVVNELRDLEYGRSGGVEDPNGNVWWITAAPAE